MGGSTPHIALYVLSAGVFGIILGWLIRGAPSKRRIRQPIGEAQTKLDDVTRQRDQFATEYSKLRSTIESLQASVPKGRTQLESAHEKSKLDDVTRQRDQFATEYSKLRSAIKSLQASVSKGRTELESAREKSKSLAKNVFSLRAKRKDSKVIVRTIQNALTSLKQQTVALQTEFDKSADLYKRELVKSFEKRKVLEEKVENGRLDQESFTNLLESSISEHGSTDKMIVAAQLRLGQLDVLERNVNKLEAENAQLSEDATRTKQEYEALERHVAELDELRIHNEQLVRYLESLESSRKQHEDDAE